MLTARGKGLSTPNEAPTPLRPHPPIATPVNAARFMTSGFLPPFQNRGRMLMRGFWRRGLVRPECQRGFSTRLFFRFYLVSASWMVYGIRLCMQDILFFCSFLLGFALFVQERLRICLYFVVVIVLCLLSSSY